MNGPDHATFADRPVSRTPRGPAARPSRVAAALVLACLWLAGPGAGGARAQDAGPADILPNDTAPADPARVRGELDSFGLLMLAQPFPYEARDVAVSEVIRQMSLRSGIPMIAAEGLSARVNVANAEGTLRDVLDSLATGGQIVWWFDGAAVHVEPPSALVSRLVPLKGVPLSELRAQMQALQMDETAWPLVASGDAQAVRVVGPQGYADAVAELVAALAAGVEAVADDRLPIIIRGPGRRRGPLGAGGWTADPASPAVPYPAAPYPAPPSSVPPGDRRAVPVPLR